MPITRRWLPLHALALVLCLAPAAANAATQMLPAGKVLTVTAAGSAGTLQRLADEPAAPIATSTTTVSVGTPVARGPYGNTTWWSLSVSLTYTITDYSPPTVTSADGTLILAPPDGAAKPMTVGSDACTAITFLTDGGDVVFDGTLDGVAPAGIVADASAGTWTFTKTTAGVAEITSADDDATAGLTLNPGGSAPLVLGKTGDTVSSPCVVTLTAIPVLPTTGATFGSTTISEAEAAVLDSLTATKAEIQNECDRSAQVQAISGAGAITTDGTIRRVTLTGGAYAFTLAAPAAVNYGDMLVIEYIGGDTDADTLALTNCEGGTAATSASFNADGEGLILVGAVGKWVIIKEFGGVTLS